jgi:hypothetical protein
MCRILIKSAKEETVHVTLLHNYEHNDDGDDDDDDREQMKFTLTRELKAK